MQPQATLAHFWMALEALTKPQIEELKRTLAVESNQLLAPPEVLAKAQLQRNPSFSHCSGLTLLPESLPTKGSRRPFRRRSSGS